MESARGLPKKRHKIPSVKIDLSKMDEKASQFGKITSKLKERENVEEGPSSDDLRYIG